MNYLYGMKKILYEQIGCDRKFGMIQERLLKSGRKSFTARAYGPEGKPYHRTFGIKRDAKVWLVKEKAKKCEGDYVFTPNKITIDKYFNYYLDSVMTRLEYGTHRAYRIDIKNHILPILGEKRMINVTHDDGILLQKIIASKKLNPKTNNKVLILFKQVLEYGLLWQGGTKGTRKEPPKRISIPFGPKIRISAIGITMILGIFSRRQRATIILTSIVSPLIQACALVKSLLFNHKRLISRKILSSFLIPSNHERVVAMSLGVPKIRLLDI